MINALEELTSTEWENLHSKIINKEEKLTPREALLSLLIGLEDEHIGLSDYYEREYETIIKALNKQSK